MLSRSEIMPTSYFGIVSDSHSTNIIICCRRHLSCTSCPMALKQKIRKQSRHKYTRCLSNSFENEISAFILKIKINIQSQLILSPTFFYPPCFSPHYVEEWISLKVIFSYGSYSLFILPPSPLIQHLCWMDNGEITGWDYFNFSNNYSPCEFSITVQF